MGSPSIRCSDDHVSDHVGNRSSLRSLVLCRTLRPCSVASCARRRSRVRREIRSLRHCVRSVAGINDQPKPRRMIYSIIRVVRICITAACAATARALLLCGRHCCREKRRRSN